MKRKAVVCVVLAAAAAALFVTSAPVRASETNETIDSSFKNTFIYKTYLRDDEVTAEGKAGVVTLTGTVVDQFHRALAQDTAESLPGVIRVDNQLVTKAEVAAENADVWMSRKVKMALLFHRNVSIGRTTVDVKDGVVTLKGEAANAAQKELTAQYANDIEGVTEVNNQMTVAATPPAAERTEGEMIDDASVTAQVKAVLRAHRSTSAVNAKIETRSGEVTLTGIAKNAAEISLVTKFVGDVQGVTRVRNRMTVQTL